MLRLPSIYGHGSAFALGTVLAVGACSDADSDAAQDDAGIVPTASASVVPGPASTSGGPSGVGSVNPTSGATVMPLPPSSSGSAINPAVGPMPSPSVAPAGSGTTPSPTTSGSSTAGEINVGGAGGSSASGGSAAGGVATSSGGASGDETSGDTGEGSTAGAGNAGDGNAGEGSGGQGNGGIASGGAGGGVQPGVGDCNSVTTEPILEVAADGSGQFTTVKAALDSLSGSNTTPTQIRIHPGTYEEKLTVSKPFVTLCGQTGETENTILTYSDNANTPNGNGGTVGTSGSASTLISADDVSAENITFRNSTPLGGSQAVAMRTTGDRIQFRNCRFLSFQDTLYVHGGTQYFKGCYVEGTVDFIFGAATAVFEDCTIHNASGGTAVTAPSTEENVPFGIVFLGGELTSASSVNNGSVALGRNWRPYGSSTYIGTVLGDHISSVGWVPMGENTLDTARFSEYQTTGSGANPGSRASQSRQLNEAEAATYTVDNIFGDWTPSFSQ